MNSQQITKLVINALENIKGDNIVVIDAEKKSSIFNTLIICSGNSNRQVVALAQNVVKDLKISSVNIIGIEGERGGEWVLIDTGDVVVHVMLPHVRSYYDLETLWNKVS